MISASSNAEYILCIGFFCILPVCMTTCLKKLPLTVFCLCEIKIACMVEAANDGIEQLRFEGAKIL